MKNFTEDAIQLVQLAHEPALNGVRLLMFDSNRLPNELIFELGRLLAPKELRKAARFRDMSDRRVYLTGRGMIRKMAGEILQTSGKNLEINEGPFGKPQLADYGHILPFNLSNSQNMVAIGFDFAGRSIGVDIEKINTSYDYWDVAAHYFSKKECSMIHCHRDFYRFWTLKEALLKVTGAGLVDDLPTLDLSAPMNRIKVKDERLLPFRNKSFTLFTIQSEEIVVTMALTGSRVSLGNTSDISVINVFLY